MMRRTQNSILFIGTGFRGYDDHIINKLSELGFGVEYYRDKPSLVIRAILYYFQGIKLRKGNRRLKKIEKLHFDIVLVIKGEYLSEEFIKTIKESNRNSLFVLYEWDEVERVRNYYSISKYFDRIYTFSYEESKKRKEMMYLPNFFIGNIIDAENTKPQFDLFSVGILSLERLEVLLSIINQLNVLPNQYKCYFRLVVPINRHFYKFLIKAKLLLSAREHLSLKEVNSKTYYKILQQSKVILDVPYLNQQGITQRCIDSIGYDKKLITTNNSIKTYDFYTPERILVIDRFHPRIDEKFLESQIIPYPESLKKKYSLDTWIRTLLEIYE